MADEPDTRRGDQGEWVTYLQQLVIQAGHDPGPVDGDFGPLTEAGVRSFQTAAGLDADGVAGEATWAALTTGAGAAGDADVPAELVALGAPASLSQWTEEQRQGYFVGKEPIEYFEGESDEVAVADMDNDDNGEQLA